MFSHVFVHTRVLRIKMFKWLIENTATMGGKVPSVPLYCLRICMIERAIGLIFSMPLAATASVRKQSMRNLAFGHHTSFLQKLLATRTPS